MDISKSKKIKIFILIFVFLTLLILFTGCSPIKTNSGVYVDIKANGTSQMILIYDLEDRAILNDAADEVSVLIPDNLLPAEQQINNLLKGYFKKKDIKLKSFEVYTDYYQIILAPEVVKPISELDNIYPGIDLGTKLKLKKSDMFLASVNIITPIVAYTEISLAGIVSAKSSDMARVSESLISGKTELVGNMDFNNIMLIFHRTYSFFDRILIILLSITIILILCLLIYKFINRSREELL